MAHKKSMTLVIMGQVCGMISAFLLMPFDSDMDSVGDLWGEIFWLTSAFSIAVLGYTLG